ncbi:hypothetical protein EPUS_01889 [Endocarpon pusillum Z07020]|uniref:Dol-P-Glc:Glc(2)Man(9)GlcNAc(2)-PP-Dol alpha-1,2-glucosyltransferase n=1 Tax=Endocarpon pusillum (strain Z07020 / HMAS-L-300199) TaxID=1263415 RepID=U1HKS5_ENDPU|nr:uncharacterized protein EPUS_01889 [Endocarpon pusillum Z07020]ERF69559.1 hypothetical protein EPUS_01889 [Endocarpon pusillum Z07020]
MSRKQSSPWQINYIKTAVSLATAALKDPLPLLPNLWPYLALLTSFITFVLVNGGVVLGDKENHVASIHIPQMLYLWPYVVFFSWPVILPHIIHILINDFASLKTRLPRPIVAILTMAIMALAVHFNTIVHPFTLADNRHYVFYVFRLLLRHPSIKYAAVPIYFSCAWATITALGSCPPPQKHGNKPTNNIPATQAASQENANLNRTSLLLVFLISTTLSLVTAPLVEPRYFILPWLIWRLHVQPPPPIQLSPRSKSTKGLVGIMSRILEHRSTWLYLETAWFLLVNLATCWMFLYRGFEWEQERGAVQRFMW